MFVMFEEGGRFLAGRVLSESDASAQVELDSGKRVKLKAAQQLLRFERPGPAELLESALSLSREIDLDLAWECSPDEEFGFADLARDYFGAQASPVQQAAALMRLFEAPHYFRRSGKGRFRRAPAEVIAQALAAIEKRRQLQAQIADWASELAQGRCPQPVAEQMYRILFRPDKNAPEYKAVVEAARSTRLSPLALLRQAGAIGSAYQFHWRRFLLEHFPRGTGFPALPEPAVPDELPLADVEAFSIDDSATTEIDDALSLTGLGEAVVTLGIHIAAPGLGIRPGDALDQVARSRLSTVYMPGHKITMLPDAAVQAFTLQAGRACPAVSLYLRIDAATLAVQDAETRIERVPIAANLRHDALDAIVTEDWLAAPAPATAPLPELDASVHDRLAFLHRLAVGLKSARELVRGRPETAGRPDYSFRLEGVDGEPDGRERVLISERRRGAPLDLIVAELMILANARWGGWLAELGVPGIYRSQASLLPGVKVRMGTKALPHAGIGVRCYAWSTSPLRRYTDLLNQWQIIACARHGATAALAAPFKARDAELFSVVSAFEAAHAAYSANQAALERFWALQYLRQQAIGELEGVVLRDDLVRASALPLVLQVAGAGGLARGTRVRVRLGAIDDIALDLGGTLIERLADATAASVGEEGESPEDEEAVAAGPLAIAVDLADGEPTAADNPAP